MAFTFGGVTVNHADNAASFDDGAKAVVPDGGITNGAAVWLIGYWEYFGVGGTMSVSNTGGQTWTAETLQYSSSPDAKYLQLWRAKFNGTWAANPAVDTSLHDTFSGFSVGLIGFNSSDSANAITLDVALSSTAYSNPGTPWLVTITGQTPTASASVVSLALWAARATAFGDITFSGLTGGWTNPVGQTQWRNSANDTMSLSLAYKIQSSAAATGNVSQNMPADAVGWKMIQTVREDSVGGGQPYAIRDQNQANMGRPQFAGPQIMRERIAQATRRYFLPSRSGLLLPAYQN